MHLGVPMTKLHAFLAGLLVGLGLTVLITLTVRDRALEAAQRYSDSLATVAHQRDSAMTHFSDSVLAVVDSLAARKDSVVYVARRDSRLVAALDTALAEAATREDSIVLLVQQNDVLKEANKGLWEALALSDSMNARLRFRGDSLLTELNNANRDILSLNTRVQALQPRLPKWARIRLEVVKLGIVAKAGYELGQASQ